MKKHIQMPRLPSKLFILTVLIMGFSPMFLTGQRTTFHLSQTVEVPQGVLIHSKGPQSVRINGRGVINTRHLETKYVVSGKRSLPYIYVIHKTLEINTWNRDQVKQEVTVTLETRTAEQAIQLQAALRPVLELAPGNSLSLNCELNIAQFSVNNSWFREDKNSLTLSDGRVFPVKYLEISNRFFVPESANLDLKLHRTNLVLGDHSGSIKLQQAFGQVGGGCLQEMTAQLTDAHVKIDKLDEANLQLTNCDLNLGQVGKMTMNSSLSAGEIDSVGQLLLNKSVSDRFTFGRVDIGNAADVFFSTFEVDEIWQSWQLTGKRTSLTVGKASQALHSFQIDNQDGLINFPLADLLSYKLWCDKPTINNYQLPDYHSGEPGAPLSNYYEFGAHDSSSLVHLTGKRCEFRLRPE